MQTTRCTCKHFTAGGSAVQHGVRRSSRGTCPSPQQEAPALLSVLIRYVGASSNAGLHADFAPTHFMPRGDQPDPPFPTTGGGGCHGTSLHLVPAAAPGSAAGVAAGAAARVGTGVAAGVTARVETGVAAGVAAGVAGSTVQGLRAGGHAAKSSGVWELHGCCARSGGCENMPFIHKHFIRVSPRFFNSSWERVGGAGDHKAHTSPHPTGMGALHAPHVSTQRHWGIEVCSSLLRNKGGVAHAMPCLALPTHPEVTQPQELERCGQPQEAEHMCGSGPKAGGDARHLRRGGTQGTRVRLRTTCLGLAKPS